MAPTTSGPTTTTDIEHVWREFGDQLRSFVRRRVADVDRADDIVGDVLLRVHRNLHTVHDPERLAAWIFQIARNAVTDEYRRAPRRDVPVDVDDTLLPATEAADDHDAVLAELAACMRPLLGQLSDNHRRALELTDLEGVTQAEAARLEGVSVSGMKSRVQRGRRQLADLLAQCCALTLDARGMPVDYKPAGDCSCA